MPRFSPHPQEDVFRKLIDWGGQKDSIRAILLTSTRAVPGAAVDAFSDFDIILIVDDIRPFHSDRSWIEHFGNVLVTYWDPIHPEPGYDFETFGNVIHYADGLRIDFTLWPAQLLESIVRAASLTPELDAGYRILLDKGSFTAGMKPPSYTSYIPVRPTEEVYRRTVEEFFSDAPPAAKYLLRGELFPAKWCLDYDMKHVYLRPVLEWWVELEHNWSLPVGALGSRLKKYLPAQTWAQLENTYAGADLESNWEALFRTMAFFRQMAMDVGERLGYVYPLELDEQVTAFVRKMRETRGVNG